jgi:hypothetical protein
MLVGVAIDAHVTITQRGRAKIEQAQLARSVFRLIGDDIRNAIVYAPLDFSSVANLNLDADLGGGTDDTGGDMGGDGMGDDGMGGMSPDGTGGQNPSGNQGAPGGTQGGNSQSGNPQNSGGQNTTGGQQNTGSNSNSGGSNTSGTNSDSASALDEESTTVEDPPGVYGSSYYMEVDVSRLPRVDEYDVMLQNGDGAIADVPSDVKTVAYQVVGGSTGSQSPGGPMGSDSEGGLVRRSVDRAVTQYAYGGGGTSALDDSAAVLAPEVTEIVFQYFDGSNWGDTWDMVEKGAPPLAIRVTLTIETPKVEGVFERVLGGSSDEASEITTYSQVVHLPAAEGAPPSTEDMSTDPAAESGNAASAEAAP